MKAAFIEKFGPPSVIHDCSLRASAFVGFTCPERGTLTKPIFIADLLRAPKIGRQYLSKFPAPGAKLQWA